MRPPPVICVNESRIGMLGEWADFWTGSCGDHSSDGDTDSQRCYAAKISSALMSIIMALFM